MLESAAGGTAERSHGKGGYRGSPRLARKDKDGQVAQEEEVGRDYPVALGLAAFCRGGKEVEYASMPRR